LNFDTAYSKTEGITSHLTTFVDLTSEYKSGKMTLKIKKYCLYEQKPIVFTHHKYAYTLDQQLQL